MHMRPYLYCFGDFGEHPDRGWSSRPFSFQFVKDGLGKGNTRKSTAMAQKKDLESGEAFSTVLLGESSELEQPQ